MLHSDHSTADALRELSVIDNDPSSLSRRRFLQAVAYGGVGGAMFSSVDAALGGGMLSARDREAWAAPPIADTDGILINIIMFGGNDGLNTLVPYTNGDYYRMRGSVAIPQNQVLALDGSVGLHPNLPFIKRMYDQGQVAVVQGVGYQPADLSHFSSMGIWMAGKAGTGAATSGWLGRWLDGIDPDPFRAVTIGTSIPLHMVGNTRRATGVPDYGSGFGTETDGWWQPVYDGLRGYATAGAGRGSWHDAIGSTVKGQLDVAQITAPLFGPGLPEDDGGIMRKMVLAARLVNADIGLRVIDLGWGDFDTHDAQAGDHASRMKEFNDAIEQFFISLDDRFRSRVTISTMSEFGRTPYSNDSGGTDHGTASCLFVIGAGVNGGLHGQYPSLSGLRQWDDLVRTVDFRSVYASVIDGWLGGGADDVLGGSFERLPLFKAAPGAEILNIPAPPALFGDFVPLQPARVLDTRNGIGGRSTPAGPGTVIDVQVMGVGGVPTSGVTAVALNVTADQPTASSYFTIWPAREARPNASSLNFTAGKTVPNLVVMKPGANGKISLFNESGQVHAIADIVGYFRDTGADRMLPVQPFRLLDTRNGIGAPKGKLGGDATMSLQVTGVANSGIPAAGVDAVVLNMTVDQPTAWSFLTVWPKGEPLPNASSLNFNAGQTVPNLVIAKVGADGQVNIFNAFGQAHVIADVVGCFTTDSFGRHHPAGPERLLDTRNAIGAPTGPIGQAPFKLQVSGRAGVPANATAAVLNMTVTGPTAGSFLTVYPSGTALPNASNLNYSPGLTVANLVIVKLGPDGAVDCQNAFGQTDLIADIVGYFADS
jgi:uncharacterized protein (DUF1501 family)